MTRASNVARESQAPTGAGAEVSREDQQFTWNPDLEEALYNLLYLDDSDGRTLEAQLRKLERKEGAAVYSELIHLLSHLRFRPTEAKEHWQKVLAHRRSMRRRLGKPVDLRVALVSYFVEVNRQLKNPKIIELRLFEQAQASIYRDELTGLYNYRYFREYLAREIQRGERHNPPLSLVMIDLDNFKHYNDRNGHEAGNHALTMIASLLNQAIRKTDISARYGGEEFVLVLPSTPKTNAHQVATRACRMIESHAFPHEERQPGGILTVSMGIATYPADSRSADDLVRCADSAMYCAKERGKNQIFLFGENRRSFRRIDAALDGRYCVVAAEYYPLTTVNLGEGGILFIVDQKLAIGSLIDINLTLPDESRPISTSGRVIRVEEKGEGRFEAAIRIIEMGGDDQRLLSRYLQQQTPDADPPSAEGAA
jgi:diguanylate cyclase (GGDEF)-like protein